MTNQGSCGSKIRVLFVDDHALMRQAIAAVIHNEPDMLLTATAAWVHRRGAFKRSLRLLGFVPMHSDSQQCLNVAS
jgi:hypothetical protein